MGLSPSQDHHQLPLFRLLLAELIGTMILTLVDSGIAMEFHRNPSEFNLALRAMAPALTVFAMIFAIGEVSGAHINPVVTFAFALRGVFPWKRLCLYWVMQLAGAALAILILGCAFGFEGSLGGTEPLQGVRLALGFEVLLSAFLVFVILATSHQSKIFGADAAFPVSAILMICGLLGKTISGASMNPARSLAPALMSGHTDFVWLYLLGPFVGSVIAVGLVYAVHGRPKLKDFESAEGAKNVD